jgi:hypothetical protein
VALPTFKSVYIDEDVKLMRELASLSLYFPVRSDPIRVEHLSDALLEIPNFLAKRLTTDKKV